MGRERIGKKEEGRGKKEEKTDGKGGEEKKRCHYEQCLKLTHTEACGAMFV